MIELNCREPAQRAAHPVSLAAARAVTDLGVAPSLPARAGLLAKMLDEIDYGLLLVDARGALAYANELGLREVLGGGALRLWQGQVQTRSSVDQSAFNAAVAGAMRGLRRMLTLCHEGASVSVAVTPMQAGGDDAFEPMALLLFGKRQGNATLSVDFYARSHGLTTAEHNVLKQMTQGHKPLDIARGQGVAISTVRSHIKNIRLKTHTGSIRELLNRVAVLPPISLAMKQGLDGFGSAPGFLN